VPERCRICKLAIETVEIAPADVRRRSAQSVPVENCAHTRGRHSEIVHPAEQLDLLVAGGGDIAERALEILPRIVAQGVELDSDPAKPARRGAAHRGGSAI